MTMTTISEWDGNPPPLEGDWGTIRGRQSVATSMSPSMMSASGSDGQFSTAQSPRSIQDRSFQSVSSPKSPNSFSSGQSPQGSSIMDRGRSVRSYGFSGNSSFRDDIYLRKVAKEKEQNGQYSPQSSTRRAPSRNAHPPLPSNSNDKISKYPTSPRTDPRGAQSPSSERTVTPTPQVIVAAAASASLASAPTSPNIPNSPTATLQRQLSNRSGSTNHADEGHSTPEVRTVPIRDEPSRIRTKPTDARAPQRQSLLMGLSATQAKRISLALLEIETHLGKKDDEGMKSYVNLNEEEELLDDDDEMADNTDDDREMEGSDRDHANVLDRRSTPESNNNASPLFPFAISPPPSTHPNSLPGSTAPTPTTVAQSLPSTSPRIESQTLQKSTPPSTHPPIMPGSPLTTMGSPQYRSPSSRASGLHASRESTSTTYSETDYSLPALTPFRPQPVRATPSPMLGNSAASSYVPGQPRPVGSRNSGTKSPVSMTSPASMHSRIPSHPPALPSPAASGSVSASTSKQSNLSSGQQMARSVSAQPGSQPPSSAKTHTPTQSMTHADHVPPPGALTARHQASHSISDMGTWRSGSSLSHHSPKSSKFSQSGKSQSSKYSPSSSIKSPTARVIAMEKREGSQFAVSPISPLHPDMSDKSHLSPTTSSRLNFRPSSDSISSTCSTSFNTEDSSPWDTLLRQESPDNAAIMTPNEDQDRADLDLLKSMSGLGKEELALIQERLVEKAKSERDKLRAQERLSQVGVHVCAILISATNWGLSLGADSSAPKCVVWLPGPHQHSVH